MNNATNAGGSGVRNEALIGGRWTRCAESFKVFNPYSGETLAEVSSASADEAEIAITKAVDAADNMGKMSRFDVARGLKKISEGIERRKAEFAETIANEAAKPIKAARGEVERAIATFLEAASEAGRFAGEVIPLDAHPGGRGKFGYTLRVPKGVIYGITPFNFPLNLVAHKVAPALAAGNSIIVKPSEKTPLTSLLLGEVFLESGLPKSALQVVPMNVDYIDSILSDERIKMISFTGSDRVGWNLKEKCGKKSIALELGGNAPVIVDDSADIKRAVEKTAIGAFAYSGQVCISVQRILLDQKIEQEFTDKFIERTKRLKMGDPLEEATDISSLIDEASAVRAKGWVDEALGGGAELLCGGERNGPALEPTVLTGVEAEMRVVADEVFAPVAVIERFSGIEEGVMMANHSRYGLQAGVFTNNLENMQYAARNLEYGGVIFNDVPTFRVDNMPYGGVKDSGFGREGVKYAMVEMSEIRMVVAEQ